MGRVALPLAGGVLTGNQKVERVEHDNFQGAQAGKQMQIDLQPPLAITKIIHGDSQLRGFTGGTPVPRSLVIPRLYAVVRFAHCNYSLPSRTTLHLYSLPRRTTLHLALFD